MLDPKFERLLNSLKEVKDIDDLAKLSIRDIDNVVNEKIFANNDNKIMVSASLLSANFLRLEDEIKSMVDSGCDMLHIDVMDGHFVPNMTIGPCVIENISSITDLPLDIHLMVENANFFIDLYSPLRPKYISVHIEQEKHLHRIIEKIRKLNISPSVVLNPHTDIQSLRYIIGDIDMVLIMSVNPGFGGQKFVESSLEKIANLKEMILARNDKCLIQVDGGVNDKNISMLKAVGVDIVVAGSFIFNHENRGEAIKSLKI